MTEGSKIFETRLIGVSDPSYQTTLEEISSLELDNIECTYDKDTNLVSAMSNDISSPIGKLSTPASRLFNEQTKILKVFLRWVKCTNGIYEGGISFVYQLSDGEKDALLIKKTGFRPNFEFRLAGVTFDNEDGVNRQELLSRVEKLITATETVPVEFIPEPDNKYDSNAVLVRLGVARAGTGYVNSPVGYVPKKIAPIIKKVIEEKQYMKAAPIWVARKNINANFGCLIGMQLDTATVDELNSLIAQ